jgi:hypothetical protein
MARGRLTYCNLLGCTLCTSALTLFLIAGATLPLTAQNGTSPAGASLPQSQSSSTATSALPRGKKLMLKDGSFHLIREYQITGDRVRYYDIDESQWEEMPAAMVDWDATKKVEADEAQHDAAVVSRAHSQEAGRIANPIDIDASLEVAPGIFMPPGNELFAFDGKTVLPLPQAETDSKLSKKRVLEQVLVPIPIVPSRQTVSIQGTRAKFRLQNNTPEFYIRTADGREPEIELIRAKIHGDNRQIENVDTLLGEQYAIRDNISIQPWQVAGGVYRFTLGQPLAPGEYALVEIVRDEGLSLYVWDFGVDVAGTPAASPAK